MRMRFLGVVLAVLALAPALGGGQARAQEVPMEGVLLTDEQEARQWAEAQDWKKLEVAAKRWMDADNANWESWYLYGLAQLRIGDAQKAVQTLATAFRLSPKPNDKLLLLVADSYVEVGDWGRARGYYGELAERYPNNADIWNKWRRSLEEVIGAAAKAAEGEAVTAAGGRVAEVHETALIAVLARLLEFGGYVKNVDLWRRYATLLRAHGRDEEARRAFRYLLRLEPNDLGVVEWMFRYDEAQGDEEALRETMARLRRLSPDHPYARMRLARAAAARGDKAKAREHYAAVIDNRKYPEAQGEALLALGALTQPTDKNTALKYYWRAVRVDPGNEEAWERGIVLLRGQGRLEEAQRQFRKMRRILQLVEEGKPVPRALLEDKF